MRITQLIALGSKVQHQKGGGYMTNCPAHDHPNPTLCLFMGADGSIRCHCQSGCFEKEIYDAYMNKFVHSREDTRPMSEQVEDQLLKEAEIKRAELEQRAKQAAFTALEVWQKAESASSDHTYLSHKQVFPIATLRKINLTELESLIGYTPEAHGEKFAHGDILVVPVTIGNDISTLEFIDGDGRKSALAHGKKKDGYWTTEELPPVLQDGASLLIGKEVTTVLSCSQTSGFPGVAALSDDNLFSVTDQMRKCYSNVELIILADLPKGSSMPDLTSVFAAEAMKAKLAMPDFDSKRPEELRNFNDLLLQQGGEALQRSIDASILIPDPLFIIGGER